MKVKHLLALLLVLPSIALAQRTPKKLIEEANEFFWGPADTYKNVVEIPEKWKDESAVVLYKNENFDYHKYGKNVTYTASIRKRIKLLDAAAVESFSDFSYKKYFRSSKGRKATKKSHRIVGVKIVKPDGSERIIDVDEEAVQEEGNEYKVAISNLEVGDVLDYYFYTVEEFNSKYWYKFAPEEETLAEEYPIVDYKLFLKTENDFYINFKSFNGAPELKVIETGERNERHYVIEASYIDKFESERYTLPLVQLPTYKFQTIFARNGTFDIRKKSFLPEKSDVIKSSVSKEEVLEMYEDYAVNDSYSYKRIEELTGVSDVEKIKDLYYYLRHLKLTGIIVPYLAYDKQILDGSKMLAKGINFRTFEYQSQFVNFFAQCLNNLEIPYEYIIAKKKYDGTVDDLLFTNNINILLKIHTPTPTYVSLFSAHTDFNEIDPYFEGTDAYVLTPGKRNKKFETISVEKLPISKASENVTEFNFTASLLENMQGIHLENEYKAKGHRKHVLQDNLFIFSDFTGEDYDYFKTQRLEDYFKGKNNIERIETGIGAIKAERLEKQKEWFENKAKQYLDLEKLEDYTYVIDSTGRFGKEQNVVYHESFDVNNNYVKKAGPNYIFEIGKLMGDQPHLEDDEKTRALDVYRKYPETFVYHINFKIPEGYNAKSVEKLNKKIENEAGSFVAEAKIEDGLVKISVIETYASNYETAANWSNLVAIIDAVSDFTNEKILLTK